MNFLFRKFFYDHFLGEIVCPIALQFAIFLGPKNNLGLFIALGMQIRFSLEPTQGYFCMVTFWVP